MQRHIRRTIAFAAVLFVVFDLGVVSALVLHSDLLGPARHPTARVVALGDSLTRADRLGSNAWYELLASMDSRIELAGNAGVNGNTTRQMLDRLDADVFAKAPSVVVVMGGTNDLSRGTPSDETIGNLRQIVERLRSDRIHVVLATIPPRVDPAYAARTRALNEQIRSLAQLLDVPLADVFAETADADGTLPASFSSDGLHLSAAGNYGVAVAMYRQVAAFL